jgi:hypothetical protein
MIKSRPTHNVRSPLPIRPGRHSRGEWNRLVPHPCRSLITYHLHVVVYLEELVIRQYGKAVRRRIRSEPNISGDVSFDLAGSKLVVPIDL